MVQQNGTAPKGKREAIREDLRFLNEIVRNGEAIDSAAGPSAAVRLLARFPEEPVAARFGIEGFDSSQQQPGPVPWDALTNSWLGHALRRCVKENRPNATKLLLWKMLFGIGATGVVDDATYEAFDASVFKPFPHIGTGRRVNSNRDSILKTWRELGEPPLSQYTLAQKICGPEFGRADAAMRKNLRNRCRQAVERALVAEKKTSSHRH